MNKKQRFLIKGVIIILIAFPLILWLDSITFGGKPSEYIKATIVEMIIFIVGIFIGVMIGRK